MRTKVLRIKCPVCGIKKKPIMITAPICSTTCEEIAKGIRADKNVN